MTPLFKKMNLKKDIREILVINAPDSFESELTPLDDVTVVRDSQAVEQIDFGLAFVITQAELDAAVSQLTKKARGDALLWFAYPKKSSKKYTCEFNRDSGWDALGEAGYEGVRQVAIDADWSALRFRKVEYIKSMKRASKRALTAEGKKRTTKKL